MTTSKEVLHTQWEMGDFLSQTKERFLAVWPANHNEGPICLITPKGSESERDLANAELICKAVNSYEQLKSDCNSIVTQNEKLNNERQRLIDSNRELTEAVKKAQECFRKMYDDYEADGDFEDIYNDATYWPLSQLDTAISNAKNLNP